MLFPSQTQIIITEYCSEIQKVMNQKMENEFKDEYIKRPNMNDYFENLKNTSK